MVVKSTTGARRSNPPPDDGAPIDFAIVADDLTGAADSGVQFARNGHRTTVFFRGEEVAPDGPGVVVLDTDSRAETGEVARRRVTEAGRNIGRARVVFKKIDSTLRGNLAAEIDALMRATARSRAVVAPAFPSGGRTTVGGTQLVNGVPVHETELARDPRTPVTESHLPTALRDLGAVAALGARELGDSERVRGVISSSKCVVVDAENDAHLAALVRAAPDPSEVMWVGSAGLALALAEAYPGNYHSQTPGFSAGSVLVVVGSLSGVSRGQLRTLTADGRATPVTLRYSDIEGVVSEVRSALEGGDSVALHSPESDGSASSGGVSGLLGEVVVGVRGSFGALALTGGDTAVGVARRLGAMGMEVFGEVEAGVPFGRLVGGSEVPVVTKAGGFGGPQTLIRAVKFLSGKVEVG